MGKLSSIHPGLLHGVYSYKEAGALLSVTSQRVARWADGYTFARKYDQGFSKPVLQSERTKGVLSFYELVELFFVREYVKLDVQLQHVRSTAERLAQTYGPYPFAQAKLFVGNRELLQPYVDGQLVRPDIGQFVADFAVDMEPQMTFRDSMAHRYTPKEFGGLIFLDAEVSAGEPVVSEHAVPTRVIYNLWRHEKDMDTVAEYYDVSPAAVSAAVRFEGQWRLAA